MAGVECTIRHIVALVDSAVQRSSQSCTVFSLFPAYLVLHTTTPHHTAPHHTDDAPQAGSLQDRIQRLVAGAEQLSDERVWRIFAGACMPVRPVSTRFRRVRRGSGVCAAVRVLHEHAPEPYAHRDIKAANVMLDGDEAVLIDFGSAVPARVTCKNRQEALRLQAISTSTGCSQSIAHAQDEAAQHSFMPYRAPELLEPTTGTQVTEATDIWVCMPRRVRCI